jgi:hypothetical protein
MVFFITGFICAKIASKDEDIENLDIKQFKKFLVKFLIFSLLLTSVSFFIRILIGSLLGDTIFRENLLRILEIPLYFSLFFIIIILPYKAVSLSNEKIAKAFVIAFFLILLFVVIIPIIFLFPELITESSGTFITMVIIIIYLLISPNE